MKLTRKQIREGLETVPIDSILGKSVSRELTAKQRAFAREVASGATKADAYRKAYKANPSPHSLRADPYRIAAHPSVRAEIDAYTLALEAAKHRTPAALRELVIQSLVSVLIDPDAKQAVRVSAAKVLGTVAEVAAFVERKEVRTISTSEDARARIMAELKALMRSDAVDIDAVDIQADALLSELTGPPAAAPADAAPHPAPTPHEHDAESHARIHTIPHERTGGGGVLESPLEGVGVEDGKTPG